MAAAKLHNNYCQNLKYWLFLKIVILQINHTIKQYDGRPFDPIELFNQLKEVL